MLAASSRARETPPRAWGRLCAAGPPPRASRNTPTGVGKTAARWEWPALPRKHPHGRGEDRRSAGKLCGTGETPPRAWGRHGLHGPTGLGEGNTPTGVGKTGLFFRWLQHQKKHPHGRGEDDQHRRWDIHGEETPPRAWGRLAQRQAVESQRRNTPTGVGKTSLTRCSSAVRRKHPHGRGED